MSKWLKIAGLVFSLLFVAAELPALADEGRIPIWMRGPITASGKYVLTRDLPPGPGPAIDLAAGADHVDIDLNGFTVFGDPAGGDVILALGFRQSVTIRNGEVRSQGPPGNGIFIEEAQKVVIEDVKITDAQDAGILLKDVPSSALRRNVIVAANTDGIVIDNTASSIEAQATIEDNLVRECGAGITVFIGSSVAVLNNRIESTNAAHGILLEAVSGALVATNTVQDAFDAGIILSQVKASKVHNNVIVRSGADGILAGPGIEDTLFLDNVSSGNTGSGIMVDGNRNHLDRNVLNTNSLSGLHIRAGGSGNTYGRNTMRSNAAAAGPCINPATGCAGPDFCDDNALPSGNNSFGDNFAPAGC